MAKKKKAAPLTCEDFDLEDVYDSEISPLMAQILDICKRHKIPMFATFAYLHSNDENDTRLCTSFLQHEGRYVESLQKMEQSIYKPSPILAIAITTE